MRGSGAKLYTDSESAPRPSALLCAVFAIAVLGGIGAADAVVSKTLTLLPPLSANATTKDVFLNSTSKIQLCVRRTRARPLGLTARRPIGPHPCPPFAQLHCSGSRQCLQLCASTRARFMTAAPWQTTVVSLASGLHGEIALLRPPVNADQCFAPRSQRLDGVSNGRLSELRVELQRHRPYVAGHGDSLQRR